MEDGVGSVEVAYGTTKLKFNSRPFDFIISKMPEMDACGLYRATRFDLDNTIWLPWTTDWFEIRPDFFSPTIGKLTDEGIRMLQIVVSWRKKENP